MAAEGHHTFQERGEAKVALPPNQSETSKDKRCEPRGRGNKQGVIGGKGLAGMSGSTLRSPTLLDQVGGWLGNKLQRKLVQITRATKSHGPLATGKDG